MSEPNRSEKKRLFVVDRRVLFLEGLLPLFASTDIAVQAAQTAPEALAGCATWQPDAALVDLSLPGDIAFEVGAELQRRQPTLRLMYLDDASYPLNAQSVFQSGAHGYWTTETAFQALLLCCFVGRAAANLTRRIRDLSEVGVLSDGFRARRVPVGPRCHEAAGRPFPARIAGLPIFGPGRECHALRRAVACG